MALFGSSYLAPGTYSQEVFVPLTSTAPGTSRIPVIIGEGEEFFTFPNIELFRGSSSVQDDQSVNENISDQVTGFTRNFVSTYTPVVDGTGKGIVTNDPTKMQVLAIDSDGNALPITVISLAGATGAFSTQDIIPIGTGLTLTYFFKRGDTLVTDEIDSFQIPIYASLVVTPGASSPPLSPPVSGSLLLGLTTPGELGNLVTVQFIDAGAGMGVPDAQAILGAGSDAIIVNIRKPGDVMRTLQDLQSLINGSSVPTLDGGFLIANDIVGSGTVVLTISGAQSFSGGTGPGSDTVFQTQQVPITDGTNGGVVTTNPADVTVQVNGVDVPVSAVNGAQGLITLSSPVIFGQTLTVTYYTNTWQNTFDLLPAANVASITNVGFGPNRNDFSNGVDYTLGIDSQGNGTVVWGASVNTAIGLDNPGDSPFGPAEVLTSLVDENVWLRPLSGAANGKNTNFTLLDTPTDGSGQARATNVPQLVTVFVGANALEAYQSGSVPVVGVNGSTQQVILYNPPPSGMNVYASYYRNTLENQQYTLTVVNPGFAGLGTYQITDNLDRSMPLVTFDVVHSSVSQSGPFAATGIVYPFAISDVVTDNGSTTETVTLTFNNDGSNSNSSPVAASLTTSLGSAGSIRFTASQPGLSGDNVQIAVDAASLNAQPVVVGGDLVTIFANWNGTLSTLTKIASYFPSADTPDGGAITATVVSGGSSVPDTVSPANLIGGQDEISSPLTLSYTVSSNVTGGSGFVTASKANVGYLNQTYIDPTTGFRVTIVNPADAVAYGVLSIPELYTFQPGDKLVFDVDQDGVRYTGNPGVSPAQANNGNAIFGLTTKVVTTLGATTGDTVVVSTTRGSGNEPVIGSYYFVTFTTNKTTADYGLKLFTKPSDAYAQYGQPTTVNRLSLGIQLMSLNGCQTFGAIQVPSQANTNVGAASDYIAALQQVTLHLPGFNYKANVVVPLSTDPTVHQALSRQLITQAGPRYKGEAIGFVGYSQFTDSPTARANARALANQRMIAVGNPAAGILITNLQTGVAVEYPVDGSFMAAAMAGLNCNPSNDVATSLTLQNIVGFSRLLITYDDPTMDFMAADGLTMLLNNNGALQVRHYKTTNPANPLTSEPTCTTIADFVAQQFRADLNQFIGRKLVDSLVTDITVVCNARLASLMNNVIIGGYENLTVEVDPADPTLVDVTCVFRPIFTLLYISVTFVVQTSL